MHAAEPQIAGDDDRIVVNWRHVLVNVFIVFHLTVVVCWLSEQLLNGWCAHVKSPTRDAVDWVGEKTYPYLLMTASWQSWAMFAPNPSQLDIYFTSHVYLSNGQVVAYAIPRIATMGYIERVKQERWRKLMENAYNDYSAAANNRAGEAEMFYIARYAALNAPHSPSQVPIAVDIARTWRFVPPPGQPEPKFQTMVFYRTSIAPKDLQ